MFISHTTDKKHLQKKVFATDNKNKQNELTCSSIYTYVEHEHGISVYKPNHPQEQGLVAGSLLPSVLKPRLGVFALQRQRLRKTNETLQVHKCGERASGSHHKILIVNISWIIT